MARKRRIVALGVIAAAAATYAATREAPPRYGAPGEAPFLTIFLIDGFVPAVFEDELAKGNLPNLAAMIDRGLYVPKGVSAFPSMTAYGFYGFLTGRDAARAGPLGLRWFDRTEEQGPFRRYVGRTNVLLNQDMVETERTIFEKFAAQHSFSLNSYANRGVWRSVKTGGLFTMTKYADHWWVAKLVHAIGPLRERFGPGWAEVERRVVDLAIEDLEHRPKIQWITLVSPDTYSHVYGVDETYAGLLRALDTEIGRYEAAARALDGDAPRYYAVVGDHGVENVERHFGPEAVFERLGLSGYRGPATHLLEADLDDPRASYEEHDAVVAINGNLMAYVYVKAPYSPQDWSRAPSYAELTAYPTPKGPANLVDLYLAEPGIEHVICRRRDVEFEIASARGVGLVSTSTSGEYAYEVVSGEDPLGYDAHPAAARLVGAGPVEASTWLEATKGTEFPYGPVRVARLMLHPGAGDLVLTSARGWDLAPDFELFVGEYRGGHGGLRADQLLAPYIVAGPGVPARRIEIATAEDLGATLHQLLDAPLSPYAEGRSLLSEPAER